MHFELARGHSLKRWKDLQSKSGHSLHCRSCRDVIENKLPSILSCRNKWPMCASVDEGLKFRKEAWNLHFPTDLRQLVALHDNANITLKELSDTFQHKLTRSEHCEECCLKGGDACQPCG